MSETRYSRQQLFFGKEGQDKIKRTKVALVGLGGLGSHIAQQLAYLGVKKFLLVDPDRVTRSNLNRLIGAAVKDIGKLKTKVAGRMITMINPGSSVLDISSDLRSTRAFSALRNCDFVFGCVDHDGPRFVLLEYCTAYSKPYMDVATDIPAIGNGKSFGGRLLLSVVSEGCLYCWGELSQDEIREYLSTDYDRELHRRIYGDQTAGKSPSVVSINGLMASAAVTEFMVHVTGLRKARPYLNYRGTWGIITDPTLKQKPQANCYYCSSLRGKGSQAGIEERFMRNGRKA